MKKSDLAGIYGYDIFYLKFKLTKSENRFIILPRNKETKKGDFYGK